MACPRGAIPMRRVTLEEIVRFPTLSNFLHAGKIDDGSLDRHPEQKPGVGAHYYARGLQFVDNIGGDAWLNVWSPTVEPDQMSLSQLWVVGSEGTDKQTVEAGWQVYPDKWSSSQAALFIYYTADNYNKTGCYNLECDGFVQVANNVYLGRGFDHYSATNGGQWGFNLQWKRNTDGNWWLFYRGPGNYIAVGYYKSSLFANGSLSTKAEKIAFGGEDSAVPSALQIGSGEKASGGWQKAAFQNKIFYIDTKTVSQWSKLSSQEVVHDCYTTDIHNIFGDWGTYLYFGGPKCTITP
jgi:Neprosin